MPYKKARIIKNPGKIKIYKDDGTIQTCKWEQTKATIAQIKEKFKIPKGKMVIGKSAKGQVNYKDTDVVDLSEDSIEFYTAPNVIQGGLLETIDYRRDRRARYLIPQLLEYGEDLYRQRQKTIQITKDWKQRQASILIHIPDGYPDIPPVGFYIPSGTVLKNGRKHNHQLSFAAYRQPDLADYGWDWFCLHLKDSSDWAPKDDPLQPHKFWNYVNFIRLGLSYAELKDAQ